MQKFERAEFEVKEYVESEHYGKFVFEPLERGRCHGNHPEHQEADPEDRG